MRRFVRIFPAFLFLCMAWGSACAATGTADLARQRAGDLRLDAPKPIDASLAGEPHGIVSVAQAATRSAPLTGPSTDPARPGGVPLLAAGILVVLAIAWRRTRQE